MSDDPWGAFGDSDDSDEEGGDEEEHAPTNALAQSGITFLTQHFVKHNPQISIQNRIVHVSSTSGAAAADAGAWKKALTQRGIKTVSNSSLCDAAIVVDSDFSPLVVPGGYILVQSASANTKEEVASSLHSGVWNVSDATKVHEQNEMIVWAIQRWACPINSTSCPWKPKTTLHGEQALLHKATITKSAHEQLQLENGALAPRARMLPHSISQAVTALQDYGYCIVRSALDPDSCQAWGDAVLSDLKTGAAILLERDEIDLYHPHDSVRDPQTYREMSMREDLRMDLRDGPRIRKLRAKEREDSGLPLDEAESHRSTVVTANNTAVPDKSCLRFHPDVLVIVQKALNPTDASLFRGNFGRYNFDGSGPDGSPQPLRIGPMGGIISLPQSADQAIHADTPHLFETHDCLPPHYVNAFCLGADIVADKDSFGLSTGDSAVGGTAFVHASHKLSFTASLRDDWSVTTETQVLHNLVRPTLEIGDLVLFDCRILHFGLANTSNDVERPMLYTNMMQAWFHDPKNWDNRESIFPEDDN